MKKKVISLLLALTMTASLAACGGTDDGKQTENDDKQTENDDKQTENDGQEDEKEDENKDLPVVTIQCGYDQVSDPSWPRAQHMEFAEYCEKELGVRIEWLTSPSDGSATFDLMLASDQLPDIFTVGKERIEAVLKGGFAVNLDEHLDALPNIKNLGETRLNVCREIFSNGTGNLYFSTGSVGPDIYNRNFQAGYCIRWDWYKDAGAPEFHNEDEFLDVLKQLQELHPTTDDGKKVYGVAVQNDPEGLGTWAHRGRMFGSTQIQGTKAYFMDYTDPEDNKIVNIFYDIDSALWKDLRYYYKANQMGLLDPDSVTMSKSDYDVKATLGQMIAVPSRDEDGTLLESGLEKDPNSNKAYFCIPTEGIYNRGGASTEIGDCFNAINAHAENIDACLKVLNFMNDPNCGRILSTGAEGRAWDYVDGVPTMKTDYIEMKKKGGVDADKYIYGGNYGLSAYGLNNRHPDGGMIDLWKDPILMPTVMAPPEVDYAKFYNVEVPHDAEIKLIEEGKAFDESGFKKDIVFLMPPAPAEIQRIDERCLSVMQKAIPKLAFAKDQAEFDKVQAETMKQLEDAKVLESIEWWETNAEAAKETLKNLNK